jgi:uncharacterized protein (TIGR02597 family)
MLKYSIPILISWLLPTILSAQVVGHSDIVGFDTINIAGNGGAGTKLTFAATELTPVIVFAGLSSALSSTTVTDSTAPWTEDQFNGVNGSHYLEVVSAAGSATAVGVGITRSITATSATSRAVTLESALPAGLTGPIGYRILKHWTLSSMFGATNSAGLQSGTAISADLVQLWNGTAYESYYYQNAGIGGTGWRRVGSQSVDAANSVIRPDQSIIVKRNQPSDLPLVISGRVKVGQTATRIVQGFNFVPNPYSVAMTLTSCGIYTADSLTGVAGGNLTTADQVLVWGGGGYQTYYYQTSGLGGTGWRRVGDQSTNAGSTSIAPGSSFIVRRLQGNAFLWAIPQHPTSF